MDLERSLSWGGVDYRYTSLAAAVERLPEVDALPYCLRILLENALRHAGDEDAASGILERFRAWLGAGGSGGEIPFRPARILAPESGGIPLLADLAAMREAAAVRGLDPRSINPGVPLDLVVDHSLVAEATGSDTACRTNETAEMDQNRERFSFLKWAQQAFANLRIVPPGFGICHQINFEFLSGVIRVGTDGDRLEISPDTLLGLDSHTPTVNALGVLGWGIGGIEAAAVLMGEPIDVPLPRVTGCRLVGSPPAGFVGTDAALLVVERLRGLGVVGDFVEFFGPGVDALAAVERATLSNMVPEFGATVGFFPCDETTLAFLAVSGRDADHVALVRGYLGAQRLLRTDPAEVPAYSRVVEIDLGDAIRCVAGPRRPYQRLSLGDAAAAAREEIERTGAAPRPLPDGDRRTGESPTDGMVAIASLASCTNMVNPKAVIAAGLLARNAVARDLEPKPWVKTSLTLGSPILARVLRATGLDQSLDALGFNLAGFGCAVCLGNSGRLKPVAERAIDGQERIAWAVVSSNRNFEGRIHPQCRYGYLASPPLVVAHALSGTVTDDLSRLPLGTDRDGRPVALADIWPDDAEVEALVARHITPELFRDGYAPIFSGDARWRGLPSPAGEAFAWQEGSTYLKRPPYFDDATALPLPDTVVGARPLLILGDAVTTDHISPIGAISKTGVAGRFLMGCGVKPDDFNTFASRRVNHDVMIRGTFGSPHLRNEMVADREGEFTRLPDGTILSVFEAAGRFREQGVPLVVVAGKNYGMGSSRDWAAKGTRLLGVRAVIAESFERIHRANLVCMGVLPLEFPAGLDRKTLRLRGDETFDFYGIDGIAGPGAMLRCRITRSDGEQRDVALRVRLDTLQEATYFRCGGVLPFVLHQFETAARPVGARPHGTEMATGRRPC